MRVDTRVCAAQQRPKIANEHEKKLKTFEQMCYYKPSNVRETQFRVCVCVGERHSAAVGL